MPVLVHGLFVASLAFPRSLLVARRRRRVPACDAGLIATNPHGTFPSSPPPPLPPPAPPHRHPVCAAGAVQPRGTRSVAALQCRDNHKSPLSGTSSGIPGRTSTALLNVVMADELCPCPPNIIDSPIRRYHLPRDDGHRGGFTPRAHDVRLAVGCTELDSWKLGQSLEHPGTLHPPRSLRAPVASSPSDPLPSRPPPSPDRVDDRSQLPTLFANGQTVVGCRSANAMS